MTPTEFLLARIAEDEAKFGPEPWLDPVGSVEEYAAMAGNRVLAMCKAHRVAIDAAWDDHVRIEGEWGLCQSRAQMDAKGDVPDVLRALVAVYVDQPDYEPEWGG